MYLINDRNKYCTDECPEEYPYLVSNDGEYL